MNRFTWDMRYPGALRIPGDESTTGFGSTIAGPMVLPGMYEVQLNVNGEISAQRFEVRMDPRIASTAEDLEAQFNLLMQIRDKLSTTHNAINKLRSMRQILDYRLRRAEAIKGPTSQRVRRSSVEDRRGRAEAIRQRAERIYRQERYFDSGLPTRRKALQIYRTAVDIVKKLADVEETLTHIPIADVGQVSTGSQAVGPQSGLSQQVKLNAKLASLNVVVAKSDDRPTQQSYEVFDELSERIDQELTKLNHIISRDIPDFDKMWRSHTVLQKSVNENDLIHF